MRPDTIQNHEDIWLCFKTLDLLARDMSLKRQHPVGPLMQKAEEVRTFLKIDSALDEIGVARLLGRENGTGGRSSSQNRSRVAGGRPGSYRTIGR